MAELFGIKTARTVLRDAVKKYRWEVVITDPPPIVYPFLIPLLLRARAVTLPGIQDRPFMTHFGPYEFQHPGKRTYSHSLTIRFEEGHNFPSWPGLDLWSRTIFDESYGNTMPGKYTTHMWIRLLGQTAEGIELTQAAHVYNAWLMSVGDVQLDYESPDALVFDATFSYDFWRWEPWPF